jgi:hypothetical protein
VNVLSAYDIKAKRSLDSLYVKILCGEQHKVHTKPCSLQGNAKAPEWKETVTLYVIAIERY